MKRNRIPTILSILITCLCPRLSANADNVTIAGETPSIPDGTVVHIFQYDGRVGSSVASDTIANGKFNLSLSADSLLRRMDVSIIQNDGFNMTRKIYIRPGAEIRINGNDELSETWEVISNIPEQVEYDRYMVASKDNISVLQRLRNENIKRELSAKDRETRTIAGEEFEATQSFRDSLQNVVDMRDIEIMRNTPVSQIWMDKMEEKVNGLSFRWNDSIAVVMKDFYVGLDNSFKATRQGIRIGKLLNPDPIIEIGDVFPDVKFHDLNGQEHSIREMFGKKTVAVLWSVGCGGSHYAVQEMPKLLDRHQGDLNGVLLSIDSNETWRWASGFLNAQGNNWSEGMEDMGLYRRFGHLGMPTVVIINPDGSIADIFLGFYTDRIEEILNKKHNE